MNAPLWTFDAITQAVGADPELGPEFGNAGSAATVTGISIDTRTLAVGDLFVALRDARDGHDFVSTAFQKGAAAALVGTHYERQPNDGPLFRVIDPLDALKDLGRAARKRLLGDARVIAVTGSAGKTTTKEMLRACLTPLGRTHASEKSHNNHWGVPLTLARMPADTQFAVFEIGMNHAGEIEPLSKMVRPHVAVVTTVEAVHLEHFASVAAIAEAKAEIFSGLQPGGFAVLPKDNAHFDALCEEADHRGAIVRTFGGAPTADYRLVSVTHEGRFTDVTVQRGRLPFHYRLGLPGSHNVSNSLAVCAVLDAVGLDAGHAVSALAEMHSPQGRGSRTKLRHPDGNVVLIDESYNANPASMQAALETMALMPRQTPSRYIAVLGDMLELGVQSDQLHRDLANVINANHVDLVITCGPLMKHLYDALPEAKRGRWAALSSELTDDLCSLVKAGDVVMIKGSNGSRMGVLVDALIARFGTKKHATD